MGQVLAISSHVVRGQVGLAASVPALQWLGHEVWALPTVLLASRPGLGRLVRNEVTELSAILAALEADGCWPSVDGVLTGYFASPSAVNAAADAINRIRQANPRVVVLVDPILGDADRLYVAPDIAEAIRDRLLPLATIVTPNLFELRWLTASWQADVIASARQLGAPVVIVTSARESSAEVTTLLVSNSDTCECTLPKRHSIPNGAGDLLAGLVLGHFLRGDAARAALENSLAAVDRVLSASSGKPELQLRALAREAS
jgi:pyridoxine kinase